MSVYNKLDPDFGHWLRLMVINLGIIGKEAMNVLEE